MYKILGVRSDASIEDIKKAYRNRCMVCHPDKGGSDAAFIEVQHAFAALKTLKGF